MVGAAAASERPARNVVPEVDPLTGMRNALAGTVLAKTRFLPQLRCECGLCGVKISRRSLARHCQSHHAPTPDLSDKLSIFYSYSNKESARANRAKSRRRKQRLRSSKGMSDGGGQGGPDAAKTADVGRSVSVPDCRASTRSGSLNVADSMKFLETGKFHCLINGCDKIVSRSWAVRHAKNTHGVSDVVVDILKRKLAASAPGEQGAPKDGARAKAHGKSAGKSRARKRRRREEEEEDENVRYDDSSSSESLSDDDGSSSSDERESTSPGVLVDGEGYFPVQNAALVPFRLSHTVGKLICPAGCGAHVMRRRMLIHLNKEEDCQRYVSSRPALLAAIKSDVRSQTLLFQRMKQEMVKKEQGYFSNRTTAGAARLNSVSQRVSTHSLRSAKASAPMSAASGAKQEEAQTSSAPLVSPTSVGGEGPRAPFNGLEVVNISSDDDDGGCCSRDIAGNRGGQSRPRRCTEVAREGRVLGESESGRIEPPGDVTHGREQTRRELSGCDSFTSRRLGDKGQMGLEAKEGREPPVYILSSDDEGLMSSSKHLDRPGASPVGHERAVAANEEI